MAGICNLVHLRQKYYVVFSIDTDECTAGTHNCSTNGVCINAGGSYTCECNTGYNGDGFTCTGKEYNIYPCATCENTIVIRKQPAPVTLGSLIYKYTMVFIFQTYDYCLLFH